MNIIDDLLPYEESLKKEIELQLQDQIKAGYILGSFVKNGGSIKYKKSGHTDIIYFQEVKRTKTVYFPGATGVSIKPFPKAKSGSMAIYIGKKGKLHEIAVLDHRIIQSEPAFMGDEVYLMEANFLFLTLLQQQILGIINELDTSKTEFSHLSKIMNYLDGPNSIHYPEKKVPSADFPLNDSQFMAYKRILSLTDDDFLTVIHGPPGTGKTQVIASAIAALIQQKQKILVTSHTNVAVDNALEKIIDFLNNQRIDPHQYVIRVGNPLRADNNKIVDYYQEKHPELSNYPDGVIVGSTLSSLLMLVNDSTFNFSTPPYDCVFLDEASMANFPQTMTAMIMASKTILLGDPHQLPPIVRDEQASKEVLTSLFEKIISVDPSVFTFLNIQYRSHPSIANYSSVVFYEGKLTSHESTINKGLDLDITDQALDGDSHLVWIDSLGKGKLEWKKLAGSYSGYNLYEAAIIGCLIKNFAVHGLNIGRDLRIITPFRLQAAIIEQLVREEFEALVDLYESQTFPSASTIDRIQGRESPIVIVSLVDDGTNWRIHKVLQDYRRINVGLTRAKDKLIIVGSSMLKSFSSPVPYFKALGKYIEKFGVSTSEQANCDIKYFNFAATEALKFISKPK